jgi:hypothetical protein
VVFEGNSDVMFTYPHNVDGEDMTLYVLRHGEVSVYGDIEEFACTSGPNPPAPSVVVKEGMPGQKFAFN